MNDEPKLLWCKVTVSGDTAIARYRWEGLMVDGSDCLDDDISGWSDDDIRQTVALVVGIDKVDVKRIDVIWD